MIKIDNAIEDALHGSPTVNDLSFFASLCAMMDGSTENWGGFIRVIDIISLAIVLENEIDKKDYREHRLRRRVNTLLHNYLFGLFENKAFTYTQMLRTFTCSMARAIEKYKSFVEDDEA